MRRAGRRHAGGKAGSDWRRDLAPSTGQAGAVRSPESRRSCGDLRGRLQHVPERRTADSDRPAPRQPHSRGPRAARGSAASPGRGAPGGSRTSPTLRRVVPSRWYLGRPMLDEHASLRAWQGGDERAEWTSATTTRSPGSCRRRTGPLAVSVVSVVSVVIKVKAARADGSRPCGRQMDRQRRRRRGPVLTPPKERPPQAAQKLPPRRMVRHPYCSGRSMVRDRISARPPRTGAEPAPRAT